MGEDGEGRLRQRVHGVTDVYGTEKQSYELLKKVSSPLILEVLHHEADDKQIFRITNSSNLPAYTVSGYKLHLSEQTNERIQEFEIGDLRPGEQTNIVVPSRDIPQPLKATIKHPTGFAVLQQSLELR